MLPLSGVFDKLYLLEHKQIFLGLAKRQSEVHPSIYGHENEMYKEPMNLKRGKDVCVRELRECGGRTEDKTKCAKG